MKSLIYIVSVCLFLESSESVPPNIVLFITDDQDSLLNGLEPMLKTKKLVQNEGTTFTNAFATSPICCPSRSSILTGLYQHNHGTFNNSLSGGCSNRDWQINHEPHTFAVKLQNLGYTTFYAGKYLNQYGHKDAGGANHVPLGWDQWIGLLGNSKYYNYSLSLNGEKQHFTDEYLTNELNYHASSFINKQKKSRPFLMVIAPPAPHSPFTPEPKYQGYFQGKKVPRSVQFNFSNNTKKHWLVRMKPSPLPKSLINTLDEIYARRWETLLSVDDLIESVINQLEILDFLHNTFIIFTSDNGFHLGQFSLAWDKRQMYEFDLKVPFIVRGPNIPKNVSVSTPIILPDIAPSLLDIAGFTDVSMDGKSFLSVHKDPERTFLIEYQGEGGEGNDPTCSSSSDNTSECSWMSDCKCQDSRNNTYICIRTISRICNFIYCQFIDDEALREAYDLKKDPFQLNNIAYKLKGRCKYLLKYILSELRLCKSSTCRNIALDYIKIRHHCF